MCKMYRMRLLYYRSLRSLRFMFTHCAACKRPFMSSKILPGKLLQTVSSCPCCMECIQQGKRPETLSKWAKDKINGKTIHRNKSNTGGKTESFPVYFVGAI